MNNFDENQNIEITDEVDELSTVFSNPPEHKTKAANTERPQKNSKIPVVATILTFLALKQVKNIIVAILAVAILIGGTFAVVKLVPEKNDPTETTSQIPAIKLLSLEEKELKKVTVKNVNGTFVMNNTVTTDDDGYDVCTWALEGYDMDVISDYSLYNAASNVMNLSAMREITTKTAEDCGLSSPKVEVEVIQQDDTKHIVLIGGKSPDNSGVYVKFADKDNIYLVTGDIDTRLTFAALDLANTDAIEAVTLPSGSDKYVTDGAITSFDTLTVSGKNFSKNVVIKPNPDVLTSSLHTFVLTAPEQRMAENVDKALAVFNSSTTVSGAYALDVKTATINKFGLNKPDLTLTAKFWKNTYTFKFKKQDDGAYAVWYTGCKMIKKVEADTLEVLSYSTINFYSTWVHLQSIDELSGFIVKADGKEYNFDINVKKSEDSATEYTIKYDGNKLTARNFQDFYRYCISLYASDFAPTQVSGNPDYELTYIYSDKSRTPTKISFYRTSATKYQFSINGEARGHVNASDLNRISTYVKQAANDEKVNII